MTTGVLSGRPLVLGWGWRSLAFVFAALVAVEAAWLATAVVGPDPVWSLGMDFAYYRDLAVRWLADGTFYLPHQFAPHEAGLLGISEPVDTLYPPSALVLFVPFVWLPAVLWWVIPTGVIGYAIYRMRPSPLAWIVMLALLLWPKAIGAFLFGNTDMWVAAAVAAGLVWGWPALAVTLKPSLLPLALVGVRHRSWWAVAAVSLVVVAVTWPAWLDYLTVMRNAEGISFGYSLNAVPLALIPVVAWIGRGR